jgi:hypothetical protein
MRLFLASTFLLLGLAACGGDDSGPAPDPAAPARSWRLGFSGIPPVPDQDVAVASILMWSARADAAIAHESVPWDSLLTGTPAARLARRHLDLVSYYRDAAGLQVVFEVDPTDGLAREREDPALVAAGRSIAEPAVQALFRQWVAAVDTVLRPDYLGLASEVNLIRVAAPAIYAALATMSGHAADSLAALHARRPGLPHPILYASLQVETAWGRLGPPGYQGVAQEAAAFPFADAWGLSSYPYLGGFDEPEEIPLDYYRRLAGELDRPVLVTEGGWASVPFGGHQGTPAQQARYVRRHAQLLDEAEAVAVFDLTFADLALGSWPLPPSGSLTPFARLGLVDTMLVPKPALAVWDSLFAVPLQ